jgi:AAA+ ATPase superfamily predicted ATPase
MQQLIGRIPEIQILNDAFASNQAELIAVYGRRRVGKTYLVRTIYEKSIVFELTGLKDTNLAGQLENFTDTLAAAFYPKTPLATPRNWVGAFRMLSNALEGHNSKHKRVVFLDEFPWLDTAKSGFLSAFDHFWNNWASKQSNLVVVICGSAASWMIQNIVRSKGGLHNRITRRMRLLPFNLYETEQFLRQQRVTIERHSILQLYMITGGIPQYLKDIRPGESAIQAIDRLCFTNDGPLRDEFKFLYHALFDQADKHVAIVRALANQPSGMSRNEIIKAGGFTSGGSMSKIMDELLESGFIMEYIPFNKNSKDAIFKLCDEYSLFYLKFIENSKSTGEGAWLTKSAGASWKSWSGLAFENICLQHIPQIKKALGISGIYTEQSIWRHTPRTGEKGAQVDLLIDRNDNCINLIEIKFSNNEFVIDKSYAETLRAKRSIFIENTGTRKSVFLTMLSSFGVKTNEYYLSLIQNQITMAVLFESI